MSCSQLHVVLQYKIRKVLQSGVHYYLVTKHCIHWPVALLATGTALAVSVERRVDFTKKALSEAQRRQRSWPLAALALAMAGQSTPTTSSIMNVKLKVEDLLCLRRKLIALDRFKAYRHSLSLERLRKHTYSVAAYGERIFNEEIKLMCAEPVCFYVNVFKYVKNEKWERGTCQGFYAKDWRPFDKYDWRLLWVDYETDAEGLGMLIVDYFGLDASLKSDAAVGSQAGWEWKVLEKWGNTLKNKKRLRVDAFETAGDGIGSGIGTTTTTIKT